MSLSTSFFVSAKTKVNPPKIKSVTAKDTTTFLIKWSKIKGAKGYVLYYRRSDTKFKKLTTTKSTSYTHKKLAIGKKYFYKVKAFKKFNKKNKYSQFSNQAARKCTNYLVDIYKPYNYYYTYEEYRGGKSFSLGGDNYSNGFSLRYSDAFATYNLKGKYRYITLTVGIIDGNTNGGSFSVYSDDSCVATYELKDNSLPKFYKIDIENANKLEFKLYSDRYLEFGFSNIKLYK